MDAQIADKLRELSSGKFDRMFGGRKERASIEAFYSERNFAPLWITNGAVNPRGKAATDYLAHVDEHGLEPERLSDARSSGPAARPTRSRKPSSS